MPTNDMTPQQRAVRVYEMLLEKPRKVAELAQSTGLGRTGVYELLNTLSAVDGVPIANAGGYWYLMPGYELASVFSVYQRLRVSADGSDADHSVEISVTAREARIVMAVLERFLPTIP